MIWINIASLIIGIILGGGVVALFSGAAYEKGKEDGKNEGYDQGREEGIRIGRAREFTKSICRKRRFNELHLED